MRYSDGRHLFPVYRSLYETSINANSLLSIIYKYIYLYQTRRFCGLSRPSTSPSSHPIIRTESDGGDDRSERQGGGDGR